MAQQKQPSKKTTIHKHAVAQKAATESTIEKHSESTSVGPEERQRLICEAAYRIAEQRGFQGNMALDDWLQAEAEVDAQFASRH